jgi:tripartite-type tricarboxylate transporter receptor subunit TctC
MKRTASVIALLALPGITSSCAQAPDADPDNYPSRSIRVIVPFDAGSATDVLTRLYAECAEGELGESVVVENVPGGDGTVGTSEAARAEADGHTLVVVSTSSAVLAPHFTSGAGYDVSSFEYIGAYAQVPSIIAVAQSSKVTSLNQLIEGEQVTVASTGPNSSGGLAIRALSDNHGLKAAQVPMGSLGEAHRGLMEDDYQALMLPMTAETIGWFSDDVRALAITTEERSSRLPDVPTLTELNLAEGQPMEYITGAWAAPAGTPTPVVDKLADMMRSCNSDEKVVAAQGPSIPEAFVDGTAVEDEYTAVEDKLAAMDWR